MKISLIVVLMLTEQCYSGVHVELTSGRTNCSLHNNTIVYFGDVFKAIAGIKCNTSATEVKWLRPNGTHVSEWTFNTMQYTLYIRACNNRQTETLLHLGDNNFNEQGIYTCKATDGSQSQTLHIGIYNREDDIPAISIAQPITLQYTDHLSFTLNCSSSGSPATNVTWYRNGTRLNGFAQTKILRNTSSSSYDNLLYVRDGMAGQYECEVKNNIIEPPSSKTINYVVPAVLSGLNVTQIGMTFARVAWEIPDSYVENYTLYYQGGCMNDTKWLRTDLNVVNLTGLDSGIDTYSISLSAHNALGSSPNMTLNLKTIGRAPAGSPLHLTIVSLGPTSISLRWSELECAQRGGTITGYMLEYKESIRNEWMSLIVPKERAEVGNLTESTTYLFRIAAMNVNGMGPFSDIETGTSTAKPSTLPTYVIAAVVLTGSLLAVVLCSLVCVIVCLYRGRAKVVSDGPEDIEISDYSVDEIDGEEPVIDYFPENVTACVGEYTVIQVLVSGNPRPNITWTHEGSEVTNDTTIEQANDGTLIIPSAESCHEGVYCMAATNMYGAVTKQLFLSLEGEEIEEQGVRLVLSESMPIPLDCFGDYVTKNHENSNEGFQMQFMCLSSEPDKTTDVSGAAPLPMKDMKEMESYLPPSDPKTVFIAKGTKSKDVQKGEIEYTKKDLHVGAAAKGKQPLPLHDAATLQPTPTSQAATVASGLEASEATASGEMTVSSQVPTTQFRQTIFYSKTSSGSSQPDLSHVCMLCEEGPPCVKFSPCGHVVFCSDCAELATKCLKCKAPVLLKTNAISGL